MDDQGLLFETGLLLKTVAAHRPVTYGQLTRLVEHTPISGLRSHLNTLLHLGLVERAKNRSYRPTSQGEQRAGIAPPAPAPNPGEWTAETDMCLQFHSFAHQRDRTVMWHRSRGGLYDLAIIPQTSTTPAAVWATPAPGADHAMIPLAVKYVRTARLDSHLFDWASDTCQQLYREEQWKRERFDQPPTLVLMLRGSAARHKTIVEYAHMWQQVLSAVVPGTSEHYQQMFEGAPQVLISDEPSVRQHGPAARVASLTHWQLGGLWQTHTARPAKAA